MSDHHTVGDHKGDFPGLIHRYQFSDAGSERLGDLDQRPLLPKKETGDVSASAPARPNSWRPRMLKAIDSKSDVAPIVAACRPNPNAKSTSEAG